MILPISSSVAIFFLWVVLIGIGESIGVTVSGKTTIDGKRGGNASIVWEVQDTTDSISTFSISTYTRNDNEELLFTLNGPMTKSGFLRDGNISTETKKRYKAYYRFTGIEGGIHAGEMTLTITNLTLHDNGIFILKNTGKEIARTDVKVNYGPERVGSALKKTHNVQGEEDLYLIYEFLGNPRPVVKCTFDGAIHRSTVKKMNRFLYNYTINIPTHLKQCDRKELICTAEGHTDTITETVIVEREFSTSSKRIVKNLAFSRHCNKCSVSWDKNIDIGHCDVSYQLQFLSGKNITTYHHNNTSYDCSHQSEYEKVRVSATVHILNGIWKFGNSAFVKVNNKPCPITTTAATEAQTMSDVVRRTSTKKDGINYGENENLRSRLNQQTREIRSKSVIITMLAILNVIFLVAISMFFLSVKMGKIKIDWNPPSKLDKVEENDMENENHLMMQATHPLDYNANSKVHEKIQYIKT